MWQFFVTDFVTYCEGMRGVRYNKKAEALNNQALQLL
jgi:hypothetical protein